MIIITNLFKYTIQFINMKKLITGRGARGEREFKVLYPDINDYDSRLLKFIFHGPAGNPSNSKIKLTIPRPGMDAMGWRSGDKFIFNFIPTSDILLIARDPQSPVGMEYFISRLSKSNQIKINKKTPELYLGVSDPIEYGKLIDGTLPLPKKKTFGEDKLNKMKKLRKKILNGEASPKEKKTFNQLKKSHPKEYKEYVEQPKRARKEILKQFIGLGIEDEIEIHGFGKLEISNASIDLGTKINLEKCANSLDGAQFDPGMPGFNSVRWPLRIRGKNISLQITGSGKVMVFGTGSLMDYAEAFRQITDKLKEIHAEEVAQRPVRGHKKQ
jgi:hypothetical protein